MSYISQSTNNSPWNHDFTAKNRTNVCILRIGIKKSTTVQQVLEYISIQQLTRKFNIVHVITYIRDKNIVRKNIQENRYIFNQIRHIQAIGGKLVSLPAKPPTSDHIGGVIKSPLQYDWYVSIF